jgi:hypothetical protein
MFLNAFPRAFQLTIKTIANQSLTVANKIHPAAVTHPSEANLFRIVNYQAAYQNLRSGSKLKMSGTRYALQQEAELFERLTEQDGRGGELCSVKDLLNG